MHPPIKGTRPKMDELDKVSNHLENEKTTKQ